MNKQKFTVLSLDGGGVKGITSAVILDALEKELRKLKNDPEYRMVESFDLVSGTSTGAILTSLLTLAAADTGRPRYEAAELIRFYEEHAPRIFHKSFWYQIITLFGLLNERYPNKTVKSVIRSYLEDTLLNELSRNVLITAYDIQYRTTRFFSRDKLSQTRTSFKLRDILYGAIAAPTYFEPASVPFGTDKSMVLVDGGLVINNPAVCAFIEATKITGNSDPENILVVSIGTGKVRKPYPYKKYKNAGAAQWLKPALQIMTGGQEETAEHQLTNIYKYRGYPENYIRLEVDLTDKNESSWELDNGNPSNIRYLKEIAETYVRDNSKEIRETALKIHNGHKEP